ncbi:GTP-binding protein EngB [Methanococcoides sp. LMO-2]|uniref:Probable GTP-binding protein EngB n=1 Tax=Methanococcoides cohabitans TaxID=3136559 RepID=A0ABU9KRG5_9EURY
MKKDQSFEKAKFEIILSGRSNVGKSSIIRELTGKKVKVGKRPGVTLKPAHTLRSDLLVTDLPGFGFMSGVKDRKQDIVKDQIVRYIENNADRIKVAVLVTDAVSFVDVVERWESRNEIPIDIEMFDFFNELGFDTIIAINKMDRIKDSEREERLDAIVEKLGLTPPWNQWNYIVAPTSAKKGDIKSLKGLLRKRLHDEKRDDLFKYI